MLVHRRKLPMQTAKFYFATGAYFISKVEGFSNELILGQFGYYMGCCGSIFKRLKTLKWQRQ